MTVIGFTGVQKMGEHPGVYKSGYAAQKQGRCAHCGNYFKDGDSTEVDHTVPTSLGGKNEYNNGNSIGTATIKKTATDGSLGTKSSCNSAKPKPLVKLDNGKTTRW